MLLPSSSVLSSIRFLLALCLSCLYGMSTTGATRSFIDHLIHTHILNLLRNDLSRHFYFILQIMLRLDVQPVLLPSHTEVETRHLIRDDVLFQARVPSARRLDTELDLTTTNRKPASSWRDRSGYACVASFSVPRRTWKSASALLPWAWTRSWPSRSATGGARQWA